MVETDDVRVVWPVLPVGLVATVDRTAEVVVELAARALDVIAAIAARKVKFSMAFSFSFFPLCFRTDGMYKLTKDGRLARNGKSLAEGLMRP